MAAKPDVAFAASMGKGQVEGREEVRLSFEDVYRQQFAFAWRTAGRMAVRQANIDDVVQDTFVVVHKRLAEYDGRASMRGWIYGILVRVVAEHRRRTRRKDGPVSSVEDDERGVERFASNTAGPADHAEHGEALALLETILAKLSAEHREVIVLSRLEEMTVPEIAECLGANLNTIYSRLRIARERFDALYAESREAEERRLAR